MAIAKAIQRDIDVLVKRLYLLSDEAKRQSKDAFKKASVPLINEIKSRAPVSDEPHSRWASGEKVATYYPGNLKRSIRRLVFRRSAAVFVGPRIKSFGSDTTKGEFKGNRVDGWYAHLMEYEYGLGGRRPQPFIRPGAAAAGPKVLNIAAREIKRSIDGWARRYEQARGR
jgi:HK97 gp10 family phage protein